MTEQCPSPVEAIIGACVRLRTLGVPDEMIRQYSQELIRGYVVVFNEKFPYPFIMPPNTPVRAANWLVGIIGA